MYIYHFISIYQAIYLSLTHSRREGASGAAVGARAARRLDDRDAGDGEELRGEPHVPAGGASHPAAVPVGQGRPRRPRLHHDLGGQYHVRRILECEWMVCVSGSGYLQRLWVMQDGYCLDHLTDKWNADHHAWICYLICR